MLENKEWSNKKKLERETNTLFVYRMSDEKLMRRVYETNTQRKNRSGGPRRTWTIDVLEAIEKKQIPLKDIKNQAHNTVKWRNLFKKKLESWRTDN